MPKIVCSAPGCNVIQDKSEGNYCPKHKIRRSSAPKKRLAHQHDRLGRNIYSTKRWKILSKKKLAVDCYCETCWSEGRECLGDLVDHIIEIKDDQSKAYDWKNLMTLCNSCHNKKTHQVENKRKEKAKIRKLGLYSI